MIAVIAVIAEVIHDIVLTRAAAAADGSDEECTHAARVTSHLVGHGSDTSTLGTVGLWE